MMIDNYYTVEQISGILNIHPKTIQRYIREGRLRAAKIGKGWRVTGHDLSVFMENDSAENPDSKNYPPRKVAASSVIDISSVGKDEAIRIMNTLTAVMKSKPPEYGQSSLQTQYIEHENMVRVTLWGDIRLISMITDMIASLTEQNERE